MAAPRSLLLSLRRSASAAGGGTSSGNTFSFLRGADTFAIKYQYSSDALRSTETLDESLSSTESSPDDLKSRIFRLRLPKRSATVVIDKWVSEGNQLTISQLRSISMELRGSRRYKHALEDASHPIGLVLNRLGILCGCWTTKAMVQDNSGTAVILPTSDLAMLGIGILMHCAGPPFIDLTLWISEWMVTHGEFQLADSDYADRIDLMTKVFGIDAAERYFQSLPPAAKSNETCTALLHSYAGAKLTDKAEELYKRIKDSGLPFKAITYNEMMTLYMSLGQVEKVSFIVEDMKCQKVVLDLFSFNLWISSCAADLDVGRIQTILDEMIQDPSCDEDWRRYINLVNIYITSGQLENLGSDSHAESELVITQREWISYDFLILLHAGFGNKDKVDTIWKALRMTGQKMSGRNYICILSSYLMLDHMKEVGEVIDQWKQSTATLFDKSSCDRLIDAFAKAGFSEKSEAFVTVLNQSHSAS
ncbi:hypothetical protein Dimus_026270 [Dionaea muscipula]